MAKNKGKKLAEVKTIPLRVEKVTISSDEESYPVFCFKHLQQTSFKKCKNHKLFKQFIERTQQLAELGWKEIDKSSTHGHGGEPIQCRKIKPQLPSFITPDVLTLQAFRYGGNNLPFVGWRKENVLHVLFIETKHGDIYEHN